MFNSIILRKVVDFIYYFFCCRIFIGNKYFMAKKTNTPSQSFRIKPKVKRPGVHAKTKTSNHKHSKNYIKLNVGQGR